MIVAEILDRSTVFVHGLAQILSAHGIHLIVSSDSPDDQPTQPIDVSLVNPEALDPSMILDHVREKAMIARVLIIIIIIDADPGGTAPGPRRPWRGEQAGPDGRYSRLDPERGRQLRQALPRYAPAGRRFQISQHTVDTCVRRMRAKLGTGNKPEPSQAVILANIAGAWGWTEATPT